MVADTQTGETHPKAPKERSPSFPFIPLQVAVRRLEEFEKHFGRHPTPANHVGAAWGMKPASSKAAQTLAALKSFGFVEYEGGGPTRSTRLSDLARTYLRAQQDSVKREAIRTAAMRPKALQTFYKEWGPDRPTDPVCLDDLVLRRGFNDAAARLFLKVYDQTLAFAGLAETDTAGTESITEDDTKLDDEGAIAAAVASQGIVEQSPEAQTAAKPQYPEVMIPKGESAGALAEDAIETILANGRLTINAQVGLDGIAKMKQMLEKYEELIKLMS